MRWLKIAICASILPTTSLCEGILDNITVEGVRLGTSREEVDKAQLRLRRKLVYKVGYFWYQDESRNYERANFGPVVVFQPSGKIQRVVGDELEIFGVHYKVGDQPHSLKLNLGLPEKATNFSVSGHPYRELIYQRYHLAIRVRRDGGERIARFLLDLDDESLLFRPNEN